MQAWVTGVANGTTRGASSRQSSAAALQYFGCLCRSCTAWPINATSACAVLLGPSTQGPGINAHLPSGCWGSAPSMTDKNQCSPALWLFARSHTFARTSFGRPERWKKLQTAQHSAPQRTACAAASLQQEWRGGALLLWLGLLTESRACWN